MKPESPLVEKFEAAVRFQLCAGPMGFPYDLDTNPAFSPATVSQAHYHGIHLVPACLARLPTYCRRVHELLCSLPVPLEQRPRIALFLQGRRHWHRALVIALMLLLHFKVQAHRAAPAMLIVSRPPFTEDSSLGAVVAQVCYYRDKQSINKFRIITSTAAGVKLTEPFALETNWGYKVSAAAWKTATLIVKHHTCIRHTGPDRTRRLYRSPPAARSID